MDRFSIIQQKIINEELVHDANACGEDHCECDIDVGAEKTLPVMTALHRMALIAIISGMGAIMVIVGTKVSIGNIRNERSVVVSCGPGIDYSGKFSGMKVPGDDNNGQICPHQLGALCENSNSKRRMLKFHSCLM